MEIRKRTLPAGWYPDGASAIKKAIRDFSAQSGSAVQNILAGIVPHAGWGYSGGIACRVISGLKAGCDTIVIVGGHLGQGNPVLAAPEAAFDTPLGILEGDRELLAALKEQLPVQDDQVPDNTVEIQLPFIKFFFPDVKILWLRAPASETAVQLGKVIHTAALALERQVVVLGSTDLTHYGSNYSFAPRGGGPKALAWVKEVNDKAFIEAALNLDLERLLITATYEKAACSAGGAACAVSFAHENGITAGSLLEYKTSYDVYPAESFVGYAGIAYCL